MSILSDRAIREALEQGRLVIDPLEDDCIQPASVDIKLADELRAFDAVQERNPLIDPTGDLSNYTISTENSAHPLGFRIAPGGMVLGSSIEYFQIGMHLAAHITEKSSLRRLGLSVSGFADPGFKGTLVLSLFNHAPFPFVIRKGMRIAQVVFHRLEGTPLRLYGDEGLGSHYQGQRGPIASRAGIEWRHTNIT